MGRPERSGTRLVDALPEDGERRLMLAVLMDAIRILQREGDGEAADGSRAWMQEWQWVESEEHRYPFAFVSICNALGIDAAYVRRRVLHTAVAPLPMNGRRYAAKTEESWDRLRRPKRPRRRHRLESRIEAAAATTPAPACAIAALDNINDALGALLRTALPFTTQATTALDLAPMPVS